MAQEKLVVIFGTAQQVCSKNFGYNIILVGFGAFLDSPDNCSGSWNQQQMHRCLWNIFCQSLGKCL